MVKLISLCLLIYVGSFAQNADTTLGLDFQVSYQGKPVALEQNTNSLVITTLRLYVGQFQLWHEGKPVHSIVQPYRLIDLEDSLSGRFSLKIPASTRYDELVFLLGTDSLSNVSGALGGDLDPTKGMYWAWNSGFINIKLEGRFPASPAGSHDFQFHLGGYLPPNASACQVRLKTGAVARYRLQLELSPLIEQANWTAHHHLMSPSAEAVRLSRILAQSFRLYAY